MLYRIYFNRHNDAPHVWSIDDGDQANEQNVTEVICHTPIRSCYTGQQANPDTPVAWFETIGELYIVNDVAHIVNPIRG
jgi:hypothetical protein